RRRLAARRHRTASTRWAAPTSASGPGGTRRGGVLVGVAVHKRNREHHGHAGGQDVTADGARRRQTAQRGDGRGSQSKPLTAERICRQLVARVGGEGI